jgi:phosphatidylglycerol---prolipoprotein diacylglyceryl transferase
MYPDLSYLFHDLLGTPVDNWLAIFKTFGFFLAVTFLVGGTVVAKELRRKGREGIYQPTRQRITEGGPASISDLLFNGLAGLIFFGKGAYAWQDFAAFRRDPAAVILSAKMHWPAAIIGAVVLAGLSWLLVQRSRKAQPQEREIMVWPHDRVSEMVVWAAVGGIVGAKLFDVFDNWESFMQDPLGTLLSGGGLAFLGGLVLGFLAVVLYIRRHGIPFLPTADAVAPALALGYGVGRIGCQLSGDGDWGIVNNAPKPGWMGFLPDWMWASRYPHHVLNTPRTDPVPSVPIEGCTWDYCMQLSEPVWPTPFYETVLMVGVFGLLWWLRKRIKIHGVLFFIYLALSAAERFFIEKIRVNVKHDVMGMSMTQAEIISIVLFAVGVACAVWLWRRDNRTAYT